MTSEETNTLTVDSTLNSSRKNKSFHKKYYFYQFRLAAPFSGISKNLPKLKKNKCQICERSLNANRSNFADVFLSSIGNL